MPSANCFDAPTLRNYLLGKLTDDQSDVVAMHLEACLNCEATIAELDRASDTLTSGLRLPAMAAEPATDDALQKALDKVQSLEPSAEHRESSKTAVDRSPLLRDYRLLEPLGFGGMGTVYKAVHTRLDRLVAVKLLPARRLGDEQAVARFQREMRVIGQLSHPAIVQATDAGEVDGTHFLVMEYVEGCDLNLLAKACGPLSIADACEIARQAALGLEYAHQQGIVHRDIKPSNLMLSFVVPPLGGSESVSHRRQPPEGGTTNLKILDLGLALLSGVQAPVDELTTVGQLMGTLDYMAPEQLEDSHQVGPAADIYALAATLYRLLTGAAPFAKDDRKTPLQKLRALATQAAPPIRERRANVPEELAAIIDRALSRDPAARFVSMSEFADVLAPWCAGHDLATLARQASLAPRSHAPRENATPDALRSERNHHSSLTRMPQPARLDAERQGFHSHAERGNEGTSPRRTLLVVLAVLFLTALGIVITIETNKGTLIVESLRDGVEVRVKKSGKSVQQLELTTGPKSTRLAAGEYEIEIIGDADGLQIQNGNFVLKRGDTVVAKVTEFPKGQPAVAKPAEPVAVVAAGGISTVDHNHSQVAIPNPAPGTEPDDEKPNPTAKSIDQGLADHPDRQAEAKFREALRIQVELSLQDQTLTDAMAFLSDFTKVPIWLDEIALTEEAIPLDVPITMELKNVSLSTALLMTLRPLQLTYFWDGTSIAITTMAKAKEQLITRSYPVGRSLPMVRKAVRLLNERGEEVRKAKAKAKAESTGGGFFDVPTTIPRNFEKLHFQFGGGWGGGGFGAAPNLDPPQPRTAASHYEELFDLLTDAIWRNSDGEGGTLQLLGDVLVIRQTRPAHEQIESVLRILEQAAAGPLPQSPVEIRRPDYPSAADQKLREKLSKSTELEMSDAPLTDALSFLEHMMEVRILLDVKKLSEEGIATDAPIKVSLKNLPFRVVLHRLLDPLQLTADIEEGLLIVTTKSGSQERLVSKVYNVRDLLDRGVEAEELIDGLQSGTAGPWLDKAGEGGQALVFADRLLFVTQTHQNHDETANFLRDLRSQLSEQPLKKPLVKAKPKPTPSPDTGSNLPPATRPTTGSDQPTNAGQPRYDGKSFDEWLGVLDVERSPARLADALQALRLLHQENQAAKVAQRVLMLFRAVDSSGAYGASDKRRSLSSDVDELLATLPQAVLEIASVDELKNGNARSRKFVFYSVISSQRRGPFVSENLARAVLQVSRDNDSAVRTAALRWLVQQPLASRFPNLVAGAKTRFREALSDKTPAAALSAVRGLSDSEPDTQSVLEALTRLIGSPAEFADFTEAGLLQGEALKLAVVMGPRAAAAAPAIAPFLLLRDSPVGQNGFSMGSSMSDLGAIQLSIKSLAALALARMGKAAIAALPTVEEALKQFEGDPQSGVEWPQPSGGGGFGSSRNAGQTRSGTTRLVIFRELLIATKARLEDRAATDPERKPTDVKLEDMLLPQSLLKLLQTEQVLLKEHYGQGSERPELRELDQKLKAAEEEFHALWKLYKEQLKNLPRPGTGT